MQVNKPIELFIPKNIYDYLQTCILKDKQFNIDLLEILYLINYIICKELNCDKKTKRKCNGFITINRNHFKVISKSKLNKYIQFLIKYEILICDNIYIKGKKSLGYKINIEFHYDFHTIKIMPGTKLFNRIIQKIKNKKSHYSNDPEYIKTMRKTFMHIDFDFTGAMNWIKTVSNDTKKFAYHIALKKLQDKRFRYFKRNKTNNRLDSNFTNLKKELRTFLKGDYDSIDLNNSQPFFLSQLLKMIFYNDNNPKLTNNTVLYSGYNRVYDIVKTFGISVLKEVSKIRTKDEISFFANYSKFAQWTLEGKLYEQFMNEFDMKFTRSEVKEILFAVLFSKNSSATKTNKIFFPYKEQKRIFASVFPEIYEVIKVLKEKDHRLLSIFLQKMESYIFIDIIAQKLCNAGIVPFTIHDSVIIERNKQDQAMNIIKDVFKDQFGIVPTFTIENLLKQRV